MGKIRVLQLGKENWSRIYQVPEEIAFTYAEKFVGAGERLLLYDLVFIDRQISDEEAEALHSVMRAYTLYVTSLTEVQGKLEWLYRCKKGKRISHDEIQDFLIREAKFYYAGSYGEKFHLDNLAVSRDFTGAVKWKGNYALVLKGDFGNCYTQAVFWRGNIPIQENQMLDLWLEYKKTSGISVELTVTQFASGSISDVLNRWEFNEGQLGNVIRVFSRHKGMLFFSLRAKGSGELKVIALHDRWSRGNHGYFLPGGERYVMSDREEIFAYFDPGDLRPPLNVYFSGYKTQEGFEGYYMMRKLGSPFLLIAEPRLEGGCFYMGTEEYERLLAEVIRNYMDELKFTEEEVIFSGMSMGTYGALYYGCNIRPHAILLGKPLASIGDVAANEKQIRPGGFPTSLDVLKYVSGGTDQAAVQSLNERFWKKFDGVDWKQTKFIVSYMLEDDYDAGAYQNMVSHLSQGDVHIYGKGMHGRHNDNTAGIVAWFTSQFEKILREDFGRVMEGK